MEITILFDPITAAEVKQRLEIITQNQQIVNTVAVTMARMNGASPDTDVRLNETGTGIVITVSEPYEAVDENGSVASK